MMFISYAYSHLGGTIGTICSVRVGPAGVVVVTVDVAKTVEVATATVAGTDSAVGRLGLP